MAGCLPTDPGRQRPDSRVVQPPSPGPEDGALVLMPQAVEGPSAVRVWRLHTHTPRTPQGLASLERSEGWRHRACVLLAPSTGHGGCLLQGILGVQSTLPLTCLTWWPWRRGALSPAV